jgi:hypothetical protein
VSEVIEQPRQERLPAYGHKVCEAKINPAPKSINIKLVTKVSPLAAKDKIMAPIVSAPALMCFGSIINVTSRINKRRQEACQK